MSISRKHALSHLTTNSLLAPMKTQYSRDIPIVYIVFNRPDHVIRTFEAIRKARPRRLYIISDGPRDDRIGEEEQVRKSRQIAEACDWQCDVSKIYSQKNLGCGKRISGGLSSVFEKEQAAIVLEDDCLAGDDFFRFCTNLLDQYETESRVMSVSGNNFQQGNWRGQASYYFSKYTHIWGWATWRRAWNRFHKTLSRWPAYRSSERYLDSFDTAVELYYWSKNFEDVYSGISNTWGFTWLLTSWMNNGLNALPNANLVSNIGFGESATHTRNSHDLLLADIPVRSLGDIRHPQSVERCVEADRFTDASIFSGRKFRLKKWIRAQRFQWSQRRAAA